MKPDVEADQPRGRGEMALAVYEMRSSYEDARWEKWPLPARGQRSQRAASDASKDRGPLYNGSVCLESSGNWELGYSYVLCFLKHFLFVFCKFSFECACRCWLSQEEMRPPPVCRWDPGGREWGYAARRPDSSSAHLLSVRPASPSQYPCWEVPSVMPTYR